MSLKRVRSNLLVFVAASLLLTGILFAIANLRFFGQPETASAGVGSAPGPVAAYSFDEGTGTTAEDITGNGHTATIEGAEWTTAGRYGDGLEFDASEEDRVTIPASEDFNFEEFTLEAWVKPSEARQNAPVIANAITGTEKGRGYALYAGGDGGKNGHPEAFTTFGEEFGSRVLREEPLPNGAWTHLAATFDGAKLRLYVDGELVDTVTAAGEHFGEGELQIGSDEPWDPGHFFDGRIDEVRLYNRALNAGEVQGDMAAPIQTPQQAPVAAYSFDEGEGTTAEDITGNGHTATIEGATWTNGKYGDGLQFNAEEGDVVKVPDSPELDFSEEFTLEAWVRPSAENNQWSPLIDKQIPGDVELNEFAYYLYEGDYESDRPKGGTFESESIHATEALPQHAWSHVALTYDGAIARLYVNGELVDQGTAEAPPISEGDLEIGGSVQSSDYFGGRIDEVRLYNRALNAGEVGADMEAPIQTPQRGPVAAYSFDEGTGSTVTDITGNEHTATIEGAEWTTAGKYGGALEFDASEEDQLTIPASEDFHFEEFTLEAWVKPDEARELAPVIANTTTGPEAGPGYALFAGGDGGKKGHPEAFTTEGDLIGTSVYREEPLPNHAWSHLAVTFDGAEIRLYVDGELVDTTAASGEGFGEGELQIGGDEPWDEGGFFGGRIDEVRLYNRALNASEVGADMAAPIQTPQQAPVAAYSFDEGEGTTAEDLTGDGHTATIEGATWAKGKYGDGLQFNAAEGDVVKVPDSPELDFSEEFTLEAWVRPSAENNQWSPLIDKQIPGDVELNEFAYYLYEGDYESDRPKGGTLESESIHATEALPQHAWSHVALTYDGARARLYVNGEMVDQGTAEAPPISEGNLEIGGSVQSSDYFDGRIDEVRLYNRALNAGEVQGDMAAPIQTPQQAPVAAYSFDEGEGTTAEDITGNEHTATISGAEWTRGKYGDALKFNGTSSCVSIADAEDLRLGEEFTLESWVRAEGELKKDPIVFKEGSSYLNYALDIGHATTGKGEGSIGITASPHHAEAASTANLEANVWTHLATTFDGAKLRLYVNGELAGTKTVTGANSGREGALKIGCDSQYGEHFKGRIDEVRLYNRALGAGELDPSWTPDKTSPVIALAGTLTEGLENGTTEYSLNVKARDGSAGFRGAGLRNITISVDGATAQSVSQQCPQTNCGLEDNWTFDTSTFGFEPHQVAVSATDQVGNSETDVLPVPAPNGSIPACSSTGTVEASPDKVEELPGGGKNYVYYGAEEERIEYPIPPSGFDPSTASAEELDLYAYPPRPSALTEADALAVWEETVGQSKGSAEPGGCMGVGGPSYESESGGGTGSTTLYQPNFGGWTTEDPTGPRNEWRGAQMQYREPILGKTCPEKGATRGPGVFEAFVGVEGPSTAFFQAGTNEPYGEGPAAFTEVFRAGGSAGVERADEEPEFQSLQMKEGDMVFNESLWLPGREAILNYTEDLRTHLSTKHRVRHLASSNYDGRHLDFKIEVQPDEYQLQNFGSVRFFNAFGNVTGEGWKPLGALEHRNKIEMQEFANGHPVGNLLASAGPISSNGKSFLETWHHCHS